MRGGVSEINFYISMWRKWAPEQRCPLVLSLKGSQQQELSSPNIPLAQARQLINTSELRATHDSLVPSKLQVGKAGLGTCRVTKNTSEG